jgi:hypothetical protein
VAQLYQRALGSLLVASYDLQDYGGGNLSRLHTGQIKGAPGCVRCPLSLTLEWIFCSVTYRPMGLSTSHIVLQLAEFKGKTGCSLNGSTDLVLEFWHWMVVTA